MRELLKKYKRIVVCAICLLCILTGNIFRANMLDSVSMQNPGGRWSGDGNEAGYAAAFFPQNEGLSKETVKGFAGQYKEIINGDGLEVTEDKKIYNDAYSCEGTLEIAKKPGASATEVNVTAVGGDYFFFHPMQLLSGSYIYEDDLMYDRIVLDENAAWYLYGSADIAGKTCAINDKYYYIAGVVKREKSNIKDITYGERCRIYMHYDEYVNISDSENAAITVYELVYPEVITGRTAGVISKVLGQENVTEQVEGMYSQDTSFEIVDMQKRFNILSMWNHVTRFAQRGIQTKAIVYPFWENECRMTENYLSVIFLWNLVWSVILVVILTYYVVKLYKAVSEKIRFIFRKQKA